MVLALTQQQNDLITIALVAALVVVLIIAVIRKAISNRNAANAPAEVETAVSAPVAEATPAPGSAGKIKLHSVPPKTAAMLMAIVADKLGKPINELRFISIKEVK